MTTLMKGSTTARRIVGAVSKARKNLSTFSLYVCRSDADTKTERLRGPLLDRSSRSTLFTSFRGLCRLDLLDLVFPLAEDSVTPTEVLVALTEVLSFALSIFYSSFSPYTRLQTLPLFRSPVKTRLRCMSSGYRCLRPDGNLQPAHQKLLVCLTIEA